MYLFSILNFPPKTLPTQRPRFPQAPRWCQGGGLVESEKMCFSAHSDSTWPGKAPQETPAKFDTRKRRKVVFKSIQDDVRCFPNLMKKQSNVWKADFQQATILDGLLAKNHMLASWKSIRNHQQIVGKSIQNLCSVNGCQKYSKPCSGRT